MAGICPIDDFVDKENLMTQAVRGSYSRQVWLPPGSAACPAAASLKVKDRRWVWKDKLPLTPLPKTRCKALAQLRRGESVALTGKKGGKAEKRLLNCREKKTAWVQVRRLKDGKTGWVYEGALSPKPIKTADFKGQVLVHNPNGAVGEDWGFFVDDVSQKLRGSDLSFDSMMQGDRCVALGAGVDPIHPQASVKPKSKDRAGYILYKNGKWGFVAHDKPDAVLKKIQAFFGIKIP